MSTTFDRFEEDTPGQDEPTLVFRIDSSEGIKRIELRPTDDGYLVIQGLGDEFGGEAFYVDRFYALVDWNARVAELFEYHAKGRKWDSVQVGKLTGLSKQSLHVKRSLLGVGTQDKHMYYYTTHEVATIMRRPLAVKAKNRVDKAQIVKAFQSLYMRSLLTPDERKIIEYRYGLEDGRLRSMGEVARLIGFTRQRVHQLESRALGKLLT